MSLLVTCNAGSTNTKLAAFEVETLKEVGRLKSHSMAETLEWLCAIGSKGITVIGHRVVHGGRNYTHPVFINSEVVADLNKLAPLAPLHQPAALHLIEEVTKLYPQVPLVACFDTAFHHRLLAYETIVPIGLPEGKGAEIRRYGFHGLSYQYIAQVMPLYEKAVVAHLGGGSSACAMHSRRSVATTMGFSALDGMMMSSRCGAVDAGVVLYLLQEYGLTAAQIQSILYHQSGLQAVSGGIGDMQELLAQQTEQANFAIELYCYLAAKQISGLLPALGGMEALIFTGGIGENCQLVRDKISSYLHFTGSFEVEFIATNEEAVIARSCAELMAKS